MHAFDPRFPLPADSTPPPADATAAAYVHVRRRLGLTRAVVVQPNGYRFDNRCTLDAIATLGSDTRGIAIVSPGAADAELERLHAAGIRGVRYHLFPGGTLGIETMDAMAARIAALGWNINLQLDGRDLPRHEELLSRLPCTLVIDHVGKFGGPVTVEDPAFRALRRLLDRGHCWIKLSAPYESSRAGPPAFSDVAALAREIVCAYPQRCLWASNWPHNNQAIIPSTTAMLDLLLDWAPDEVTRRRILVDNPAVVYGFSESAGASG